MLEEIREEIKTVESRKQLKEIFENLAEDEELMLFRHFPILGYLLCQISFKRAGENFVVILRGVSPLMYTTTKEDAIDLAWHWVKELKVNKYAIEELPPKPKLVE